MSKVDEILNSIGYEMESEITPQQAKLALLEVVMEAISVEISIGDSELEPNYISGYVNAINQMKSNLKEVFDE